MDKTEAIREHTKLITQVEFLEKALEQVELQDESRKGIQEIITDLQSRQAKIVLEFIKEEGPVAEENHKRHEYRGAKGTIRKIKNLSEEEAVDYLMRIYWTEHGMAYFRGYRAAMKNLGEI